MNLKLILILPFLFSFSLLFGQQKKFIDTQDYKDNFTSSYFYLNENDVITEEQLGGEIEKLIVAFSLDPETSDENKEIYIKGLITQLTQIGELSKSSYKALILQIGEQIFLTKEEVLACKEDYDKMADLNMKNAWKSLSPLFTKYFAKTTIYGSNWGW